jgi:hypothetical protein
VIRAFLVGMVALAACSGGGDAVPDAEVDAAPDAPPDGPAVYAACGEFGVTPVFAPAHVTGALGGADIEAPASCEAVDAPYGIQSAGPDTVVAVGGLTPGTAYDVVLDAPADLAFYVVSGCDGPTGPTADECLLFEDASQGRIEQGRFLATAPTEYIVVDYYSPHAPSSESFTLDVYAEQCASDAACTNASTPACYRGLCVQCVTSFDCPTAAAPVCSDGQLCGAGASMCDADDASEPADDGPAGATLLADGGSAAGLICGASPGEADFYAFEVTDVGDTWTLSLAWQTAADLDLEVYDATGASIGLSLWEQPEGVVLTYLAPGRYFARVTQFSPTTTVPTPYTLDITAAGGPGCASSADCAATWRNQIYRGACDAGSCVSIAGGGALAEGSACDSQSDCALGLQCPAFFFVADADTRDTCARGCLDDSDCAPLPGTVCTTYLAQNFCVAKCTDDDQCPTVPGDDPPHGGPWQRFSCDGPTGRCVP